MNALFQWIAHVVGSWKFWIVIAPWDIGIRVRMGKSAATLAPGPHFRIPFIDEIILVNTRMRIESTPPITIAGSKANTAKVVSATVGYSISDPLKAALTYTYPGPIVTGFVQAAIVDGRNEQQAMEYTSEAVRSGGIKIEFVYFSENVEVRTYRLISSSGGGAYSGSGGPMIRSDSRTQQY